MTLDPRPLLADRLAAVEARVRAACGRAGRPREAVTLVAVTKYVGPDVAAVLPDLGVLDLGENRPQELWRKAAALPAAVRWHMIGHLQRNKVERTVPLVSRVHAVDSVRLLDAIEAAGTSVPVLLEVHLSGEATKQGLAPAELPPLGEKIASLKATRVDGLMTMTALDAGPDECRRTFAELRQIRDRLRAEWGLPLPDLSMGMSGDFEEAIEEGATLVRLGTVLFEGLGEGM